MAALKTDILISIKPEHMANIVSRTKNHEFRKYLLPSPVERMWFYISNPDQTLRYIAVISSGKRPGEIDEREAGIGNAAFNAGPTQADRASTPMYAYEIRHLYRLKTPLPLSVLKEQFSVSAPQRYTYLKEDLLGLFLLEEQEQLF